MDQFRVSVNKIQSKQASSPEQLKALETIVVDHPETVSSKNVKSFVERVGSKGCTFCPSTFKGSSKSMETFEQSQLLALSFDSFDGVNNRNLTFEKIKERAEKYNLPILLAYDSFSVAQRKKFGIVFLNSTPLSSFREAEVVQKALMEIFPEAENNCSVLKLYSGGNKVLHFDETLPEIDTYSLLMNTCLHWKNRYGATNYKRKSAEFSRETGIALNERNLPHISVNDRHAEHFRDNSDDKNMTKCIIEYDLVKKLSSLNYEIHFTDEEKSSEVPSDHEGSSSFNSFRAKDLQTLGSACKLYQEFITGKKKLTYRELLGVATNTVQIRGGATKFSDTLKTKSYFDDCIEKYDNWVYYLKYIKSDGPQPCSSFCPYHGICPHGENILSTLKPPKHTIEQIANAGKPLVELSEAWDDFMGNFQEAISSNEPMDKPTELYLNEIAKSLLDRRTRQYQLILDEMIEESPQAGMEQQEKKRVGQKYLEYQLSWFGKVYCVDDDITFADKNKAKKAFVAFLESYADNETQIVGEEGKTEFRAEFTKLYDAAFGRADPNKGRVYSITKMNSLLEDAHINYSVVSQSSYWIVQEHDWETEEE